MSGESLKILVSTDNHLGVWEDDELRRDDSFNTFEEVLKLARELKVDFVLLGGDLFHENKPSRSTLVKAIQLLTKYCLNDDPVKFKILSDQSANFVSGRVNYENSNVNIGLPVFTIHGNHDDPAGHDNLSAVDVLSSCNLVNYFGKVLLSGSKSGRITLAPILLQKGNTRLCLYGLGNIRDERLGRLFQTPGCVRWVRPSTTPEHDVDDWTNMLVVHQNRVQHGAFAKNCLQEQYLPQFVDIVIWGHEHECKPEPEEFSDPESRVAGAKRFIIQPGSSVATALSEGESKQKHAFMIEVLGSKWRQIKYPLQTVRPFVFDYVTLKEQPGLQHDDVEGITRFLDTKISAMIQEALRQQAASGQPRDLLPLIRLKIDYTGFTTIHSQRFGHGFIGKVANPHDMLMWSKSASRKMKAEGAANAQARLAALGGGAAPEQLDHRTIEDLITAHLGDTLQVLCEEDLASALHDYVEKDEKNALQSCLETALCEVVDMTLRDTRVAGVKDDHELQVVVSQASKQRRVAIKTNEPSLGLISPGLGPLVPPGLPSGTGPRSSGVDGVGARLPLTESNTTNTAGGAGRAAAACAPAGATTTGTKRGRKAAAATSPAAATPARGKGRQAAGAKRGRGAATTTSARGARGAAAARASPSSSSLEEVQVADDNDDDDDVVVVDDSEEASSSDEEDDLIDDSPPRGASRQRAKPRAAAAAAGSRRKGGGTAAVGVAAPRSSAAAGRSKAAAVRDDMEVDLIDDGDDVGPSTLGGGGGVSATPAAGTQVGTGTSQSQGMGSTRRLPAMFAALGSRGGVGSGASRKNWGTGRPGG